MKEGFFVHGSSFYLKYLNNKDNKPPLFSFVVPVKVKKTSVGRHLSKRKMSAVIEKVYSSLKPGFSVVIFNKKDISKMPYFEIEKEILELLKKVEVLD